jgi:hypothetical protein
MSREESLDALLQRLNISVSSPSPARPGPGLAAGFSSGTPLLDALSGSLATPPRPASANVLATPLSRTAGGRVLPKPSPSLLDKYLAESPRRGLGESRLGTTDASSGLFSGLGKEKGDPLASYLHARTGGIAQSAEPSSSGGTPVSRGGSAYSGSSPFAWDPLALPPKQTSLPSTPLGSRREGDFSIPAGRSPLAPALARSDDGLSVSLRLSTLPGTAASLGPSRLRTPGAGHEAQPQLVREQPHPGAGPAVPPSWQPSQSSADWSEPSSNGALDGLEALLRLRELEVQQLRAQHVAAAVAGSALGASGTSTEVSILQSKVSELQAQVRQAGKGCEGTSSAGTNLK